MFQTRPNSELTDDEETRKGQPTWNMRTPALLAIRSAVTLAFISMPLWLLHEPFDTSAF
jgi:hypothetical protein